MPAAWRVFLAAAGRFGAELPAACDLEALDGPWGTGAMRAVLTTILDAAISLGPPSGGVERAGFVITVSDQCFCVRFGSGRSVVELRADPPDQWIVVVGLQYDPATLEDAASAWESVDARWEAAQKALRDYERST